MTQIHILSAVDLQRYSKQIECTTKFYSYSARELPIGGIDAITEPS